LISRIVDAVVAGLSVFGFQEGIGTETISHALLLAYYYAALRRRAFIYYVF
jgi:hypothetical protein